MANIIVIPFDCDNLDNERLEDMNVELKVSYNLDKTDSTDYLNIEDILLTEENKNFIKRNNLNERQVKNQIYKFFDCMDELDEFVLNNIKDSNKALKAFLNKKVCS